MVLGACSAPRADESSSGDGAPRAELGARPTVVTSVAAPTTTLTAGTAGRAATDPAAAPSTTGAPREEAAADGTGVGPPPATSLAAVASTDDARDDATPGAPPYGDLLRVELRGDATRLVVTVELAGGVPAASPDGEVMGVGVDLFRSSESESDYQLFAAGDRDGWLAYLDTPTGFVHYPGTFTIDGARLVFDIPWSSVGGRSAGSFSSFADWSRATLAAVALASEDHAPDHGRTPFSP